MAVHFAIKTCPAGIDNPDDPRFRILVVDDSHSMQELFKKLFEFKIARLITLARVEVVPAYTLKEGLALAPGANVSVLDLTLPDSDSENTRSHIGDFRPPVIIVTGDDNPETLDDCKAKGAFRVFVKGQIHGLVEAVIECIKEDLARLNPDLAQHGHGG